MIPRGPRRESLDLPGTRARQRRQGMVPDIQMQLPAGMAADGNGVPRSLLAEVKTIHHNPTCYKPSDNNPGVFGAAVRRRARRIPREYEEHARKLDTVYGTTPAGEDGPCLRRLKTFGETIPFVFGASGEVSHEVEQWVSSVSATAAAGMQRLIGARTLVQTRGCIAWRLRRSVGWAAFVAAAKLKIDRCEFVGPGGPEAARRRADAAQHNARARAQVWDNAWGVDQDQTRRRQRAQAGSAARFY